jgi:site-specific DNA-cytosine methylase
VGAEPSSPIPAVVADPRVTHGTRKGNYHVSGWAEPSHCVIGDARAYKGANVADPRMPGVVGPDMDLESTRPTHLIIAAADGTWHRPMSTLELAALQGFPTQPDGDWLHLDGKSHAKWRQRIGNAVPPPTARAIASSVAATLQATADGDLLMSSEPVWVAPTCKRVVWPSGDEVLHVH